MAEVAPESLELVMDLIEGLQSVGYAIVTWHVDDNMNAPLCFTVVDRGTEDRPARGVTLKVTEDIT